MRRARAGGFVRGAAEAGAGNISDRNVTSASLAPSDARVGARETHKQSSTVFHGLFLLGRTALLRPLRTLRHLGLAPSGGRTWWPHFEFTRINIAPTIL